MNCESCGTDKVSFEAQIVTRALSTLPRKSVDSLEQVFGALPGVLCAMCFLAAYTNALAHR